MTDPADSASGDELARLRRRETELQRSNEALQRLVNMAAHDLQSILYAVAGCTRLLQEDCAGKLGEPAETYMGLVQENARRMQILIRDLLTYCRVDAKTPAFEITDLDRVFDEVLFTLATPIAEANAEVRRDNLPSLRVDRPLMALLLANLVDNGIKFREMDRQPRVQVSATRRDNEWLFAVKDNGIGIDAKYHEQIFEAFRRLHGHEAYPGSGLGLAICRRIVEHHGGRLWVESRPGEGSTLFFTLPTEEAGQ